VNFSIMSSSEDVDAGPSPGMTGGAVATTGAVIVMPGEGQASTSC
jgi:hypothetical protein